VYRTGSWPGKRRAVHAAADVSLKLHAGETVGIVGESGSGKSTVARCIARLIEPTDGDIRVPGIEGSRGAQRSVFRRMVQVVFQDPNRSLN
ncbi:microcin ABC transporter ATP-binding protein, partial [Pseudomonas sp. GW460-R15]|uniref:ATP-binding cassette domain-containing protein n=1 Tax=Pseudomonas sp. GW460-R15 TaxID=2075557 RepID=UPI000CD37F67